MGMAAWGSCPTLNMTITCVAQEVLGIPKGKELNLVSSGYPGLAYLPHTPGVVVTLGFRDPDALPSHLLGCAAATTKMHTHIACHEKRPQCQLVVACSSGPCT